MMQPYRYNPSPYGAHRLILSALKPGEKVLDVGCGPGYLAEHCEVENIAWYGVDINSSYIAAAAQHYTAASVVDLNAPISLPFEHVTFDAILLADVLEHVLDPAETLTRLCAYVRPGGRVIISLPNVAHFAVRFNLVRGHFDYRDSGILDRTHLHLYTRDTGLTLVRQCGLIVRDIRYSSDHFGRVANRWPILAGLLAYNIVIFAQTATGSSR